MNEEQKDKIREVVSELNDEVDGWTGDLADAVQGCVDVLTELLEEDERALPAPAASEGQSIDTPEFQKHLEDWRAQPYGTRSFEGAWSAIVAHIDQHVAAAVAKARGDVVREYIATGRAQVPQAGAGADDGLPPVPNHAAEFRGTRLFDLYTLRQYARDALALRQPQGAGWLDTPQEMTCTATLAAERHSLILGQAVVMHGGKWPGSSKTRLAFNGEWIERAEFEERSAVAAKQAGKEDAK